MDSMQGTVFFDRDCGFCQRSVAVLRSFDWLRRFRFVPLQSEEARQLGIAESENLSQMVLAHGGRQWGGWRAVKRTLFQLPAFYAGVGLLLGFGTIFEVVRWPFLGLAALLALGLTPLGNPLGDSVYRWIARNRHRFPGSTCSIERR